VRCCGALGDFYGTPLALLQKSALWELALDIL
jgi:hypothetical protein